jgi:hypothetical protein
MIQRLVSGTNWLAQKLSKVSYPRFSYLFPRDLQRFARPCIPNGRSPLRVPAAARFRASRLIRQAFPYAAGGAFGLAWLTPAPEPAVIDSELPEPFRSFRWRRKALKEDMPFPKVYAPN